jgi:hypothetical protein
MGRFAVRTALERDFLDEVRVADLDGDLAARFAESCRPPFRTGRDLVGVTRSWERPVG